MPSLSDRLPFSPTTDQDLALKGLDTFLKNPFADAFVLRGAAGTGKTSVMLAVAEQFGEERTPAHLLAPTGRAARVLAHKTGHPTKTVHSAIYAPETEDDGLVVHMIRRANTAGVAEVFVVDEASMVGATCSSTGLIRTPAPLITDLIAFAKQGHPRSKLVFLGDVFQLPPVNETSSAALDPDYLRSQGLDVRVAELNEIKRQTASSTVLVEATRLRQAMQAGQTPERPCVQRLPDAASHVSAYLDARDDDRSDSAIMIAWTNRDVLWMNRAARQRLGVSSQVLAACDPVVLHRPYVGPEHWLVNGEQGTVLSVGRIHKVAGLQFIEVEVAFDQYAGAPQTVSALALVDTLLSEKGDLSAEQETALHAAAMRTNDTFRATGRLSDDPYAGALRLRYGHALTAHKAQGGEWDRVFLHPYCGDPVRGVDPRWLYTALTRARIEVYSYRHPYRNVDFLAFVN